MSEGLEQQQGVEPIEEEIDVLEGFDLEEEPEAKPVADVAKDNRHYVDDLSDEVVQTLARQRGWRPDGGEKTAKDFLKDDKDESVLRDRFLIKAQSDQIQMLAAQVTALTNGFTRVDQRLTKQSYDAEKAAFESRLAKAVDEGDIQTVNAINSDWHKKSLEYAQQQPAQQQPQPQPPAFAPNETALLNEWNAKNPRIFTDDKFKKEANALFFALKDSGYSVAETLQKVDAYFGNAQPQTQTQARQPEAIPAQPKAALGSPKAKQGTFASLRPEYKEAIKNNLAIAQNYNGVSFEDKKSKDAWTADYVKSYMHGLEQTHGKRIYQ